VKGSRETTGEGERIAQIPNRRRRIFDDRMLPVKTDCARFLEVRADIEHHKLVISCFMDASRFVDEGSPPIRIKKSVMGHILEY
jgi:hypothetical protein